MTAQAISDASQQRQTQVKEWLHCQADPVYFISTYVKVRHPKHGVIPFKLWDWQAHLINLYLCEEQIVILKARQIGVSEIFCAVGLWLILFHPGKTVVILSKKDDDAKEMIRRAKLGYDSLPSWLQAGPQGVHPLGLPASVGGDNTERFEVVHVDHEGKPQPSVMRSLAASPSAGRSASSSLLILDEWAHQQFADEIWAAIQPTVAAGGKIVGISTANGIGNVFHSIYTKAEAKENTFRPVFLSWRRHPERDDAWYDRTARDLDQPWRMHQEHPDTAAEAFIQTGHPVFNPETIAKHEARARQRATPLVTLPDVPVVAQQRFTCWAAPSPERQYLIPADVAEGLEHGDYDCAVVIDRQTGEEVAELHGHWDPEVFAYLLNWLGRTYNTALLAPERNNHGHAVLLALKSVHQYPKLYHHKDPLIPGKPQEARVGWPTTTVTKPLMVDALGKGLRDDTYHTYSLPFLAEALIFAVQKNGSLSAPPGFHDDRVITRAIGAFLLSQPDSTVAALGWLSNMAALAQDQVTAQQWRQMPPMK